ncbi:MAG: hypothetical protein ACD_56C00021G0004 [uncultured bacterium]|nr:MAG: hypothetical protein ACD_56C00021G0004 [uncultured bacterium]
MSDYQIFLYKAFSWLGLAWGGFALALAGFFYASLAWGATIVLGMLTIRLAIKHRVVLKLSREMIFACIVALAISATFASFSTPTVFSGRDQGAISEAAIRLSQQHAFNFSTPASDAFSELHGKGKALNFPGFYYQSDGSLVTQFPLAYIVWLALFFSLFGISGFSIANAVLMYFFLMSFYLSIRLFLDTKAAMPAMFFVATSFVFMWFSKFTLSENMAAPLLWLSILSLMLFLQNQRKLHYMVFLASAILLCFTRIEGYAILFFSFIILFCNQDTRKYIQEKISSRIFLPAIIFLTTFVANLVIDINFYREMAKALLPSVKLPQAQYLGNLKNAALPEFYTLQLFLIYGLLGFFIVSGISIAIYAWKKECYKLVPFFVIFPTLIYLVDSNISSDHPWMLRRYMFSLMPLAIFYSGMLIGEWLQKKPSEKNSRAFKVSATVITFILIAGNLPSFLNFATHIENKDLLKQTESLSQQFSDKDLILIDQKVTSDGWSMIAGPMSSLYGKNSVYFFNIQDLSKLDLKDFEKVYLIAPNEQVGYYHSSTLGKRLSEKGEYSLDFSKLDTARNDPLEKISFPKKMQVSVHGKIFEISK